MADPTTDLGSSAFLRVLRGLLRPLVRTLIARGVGAPAFYRLVKQVYVEVAEDDFALDQTQPTDSRVSLLTGVHRRDVRAIRSAQGPSWVEDRQKVTTLATVVGRWLADPEFSDKGTPKPLPRAGEAGSFERLVRSVNKDVRPRTLLDELLRQGLVVEEEGSLLTLTTSALIGPADTDQKGVFFAANVGDHLAAAAANLEAETPQFLERAVFYNGLSETSVTALDTQARRLSQPVLETLNSSARSLQKQDQEAGDGTQRIRFGVYFYTEESAPEGKE